MTTPQELLRLAQDDLAVANRLWAQGTPDPNTMLEITQRIAVCHAQAMLAIGELLHEHFHPQLTAPSVPSAEEEQAQIDALIDEVPPEVKAEIEHRARHMMQRTGPPQVLVGRPGN